MLPTLRQLRIRHIMHVFSVVADMPPGEMPSVAGDLFANQRDKILKVAIKPH